MNSIELVASLKVDFDYAADFARNQERVNRVSYIEENMVDVLANYITSRNLLVTKLAALCKAGYDMYSVPGKSLLAEIDDIDMTLAFHGLV